MRELAGEWGIIATRVRGGQDLPKREGDAHEGVTGTGRLGLLGCGDRASLLPSHEAGHLDKGICQGQI